MTEREKIDELLKPRYKVVAGYPYSPFEVGDFIQIQNFDGHMMYKWIDDSGYEYELYESFFKDYPHLFQRLEWWQERKITELPEYIEWYDPSDKIELLPTIFKVENWYSNPNTSQIAGVYVESGNRLFIQDCKPTTKPNDHE